MCIYNYTQQVGGVDSMEIKLESDDKRLMTKEDFVNRFLSDVVKKKMKKDKEVKNYINDRIFKRRY